MPKAAVTVAPVLCHCALLCLLTLSCAAQSEVQPRGSGDVTFFGQEISHRAVILSDGSKAPGGRAFNRSIAVEMDYGLTERLSMTVGIPYVFGKYTDSILPPAPVSPRDACHCLQSDWQDFGLSARYRIYGSRRMAVTPSASLGLPSHNYEYRGESVAGRHLRELTLALNATRRLDFLSRNATFSARYSYSVVEKVFDISTNRSNLTLEGDYMLRRKLTLRGIVLVQRTHGGLRLFEINSEELALQRDRLLRDNNFRAGAGMAYSFSRMQLLGSIIFHVTGTDTHAENIVTVGVRFPFQFRYRSPSNQ